eukprot:4308947-Pyramimonas_sp.AAC.1
MPRHARAPGQERQRGRAPELALGCREAVHLLSCAGGRRAKAAPGAVRDRRGGGGERGGGEGGWKRMPRDEESRMDDG